MDTGSSDWAWLPQNLLDMILDKLVSVSDYVRVGAVCKPWHRVAVENKFQFHENKCCRQVPLLMVPSEDNSNERRSLYSVTDNNLYDFQLLVPYRKRVSGSSHGWLFTVEESFGLTLLNPFSGATIELPPIMDPSIFDAPEIEDDIEDDFEYEYDIDTTPVEVEFEVMKATLSADPVSSPNDYIVVAIYSIIRALAFIRAGDKAWTYIDKEKFKLIYDVIYYKGQIFAVDSWSRIIMIDVNSRDGTSKVPQVKVIASKNNVHHDRTYLVESSSGDLLLVQRCLDFRDDAQHTTSRFKVFKLLLEQLEHGWPKRVEVKNLGGDTLFLGDNHSICVSASKWPGCQPNSIYYTDDYIDVLYHLPSGRRDIGIFNIENGSFGSHYILDHSHKNMPPSIWIVPTVLGNRVYT